MLIALCIAAATACGANYDAELQKLQQQSQLNQESSQELTARIEQLEQTSRELSALNTRVQHLEEDNRREATSLTGRIQQLEQDNRREADSLTDRIQQLEQSSGEIATLTYRVDQLEQSNSARNTPNLFGAGASGSGWTPTHEEATDEERAAVRDAAECLVSMVGDFEPSVQPLMIDYMEEVMWAELESGYFDSLHEFRIGLAVVCNEQQ